MPLGEAPIHGPKRRNEKGTNGLRPSTALLVRDRGFISLEKVERDCVPAAQRSSNPVPGGRLQKTGVFQISAGDSRRFRSVVVKMGSLETKHQSRKIRHWRAFIRFKMKQSPVVRLPGWGGRIRTSVWWNQNQPTLSMISTGILKKAWNTALKVSIG